MSLAERNADTPVRHIADFRDVLNKVKAAHLFTVVAMEEVPPDHPHCA